MNNIFSKDRFNIATDVLLKFIEAIPKDSLKYRPDVENGWTIYKHIIHIAESELNAFLRLKTILGEPGKETFVIGESKWINNIDCHKEYIDDYLLLLKIIRKIECNLLINLDYEKYESNKVIHPDYGEIDIKKWIECYTSYHFDFHIKLMKRNINLWNKNKIL